MNKAREDKWPEGLLDFTPPGLRKQVDCWCTQGWGRDRAWVETAGAERPDREHGPGGTRIERWEIERTC